MSDDGIDWKMEAIRGNRLHAAEEQKCLALTARIEALEAAMRKIADWSLNTVGMREIARAALAPVGVEQEK
jgi:hypothetical protein